MHKNGPSFPFWDHVIPLLVETLRPRAVLQVGAKDAAALARLVETAERHGATLHVASLEPNFDVEAARQRLGDRLILHRARGRDVVPLLPVPELVLIDDDPNWHNVHGLLSGLRQQAQRLGQPFPTVAVAQTAWPYGRRDSYDEPSAVPDAFRQPYERAGITPGSAALSGSDGAFADRYNAATEYDSRSGCLTALEDFMTDAPGAFALALLPMFHGLALIHPIGGPAEPALRSLALGKTAAALVADLEAARVALAIECDGLRRSVAQATFRNDALHQALRATQQPGADRDAGRGLVRRIRRSLAARRGRPPGSDAEAQDLATLRASPIFQADWYLTTYPDVAAAGLEPALHYLRQGAGEGRDPGPGFSSRRYLAANPDVTEAELNPLLHYLRSGRAEGRSLGED